MKRSHLITAAVLAAGLGGRVRQCRQLHRARPDAEPANVRAADRRTASPDRPHRMRACPLGGLTDSGVAYRGRERIGIDTFPGPAPQRALGPR